MTTQPGLSGKSQIDWSAFAAELAPVRIIDEPVLIKKRSRDFFWYSPVLNSALKRCFGDLVAQPDTAEELAHCLATAWRHDAPVTLRGGGTGNYGQSVPLAGGLIIETTGMNRVTGIGPDWVRAEAGALMADINRALEPHGRELAMFPSTQDIATIGGFVAGGSAGIGSVASGPLREAGNIREIRALSLEEVPQTHVFTGDDIQQIHHAWGLNGAMTEVVMRTVPRRDWIGCMATFETYEAAYAAGYALAEAPDIARKLVSVVDARIVAYFPRLDGHLQPGRHLLVSLVPAEDMQKFRSLIATGGGTLELALDEAGLKARNLPHVFEFSYNHTTLQVLKADRRATYQQYGVNHPERTESLTRLRAALGEEVWMHHEFSRYAGAVTAADLPIIWFTSEERLREIDQIYRDHDCTVYDAHVYWVEGGGMKPDYRHLAWKRRLDPKGLLNVGKSRAWASVSDMAADEIEALAAN